jgi:hypothetical protein
MRCPPQLKPPNSEATISPKSLSLSKDLNLSAAIVAITYDMDANKYFVLF